MKRICTLKKTFNDGWEVVIEFVNIGPNKNREVVREKDYYGKTDVSIYNNLDDQKIQKDIEFYKKAGYKDF